jgi:hypothetical protein
MTVEPNRNIRVGPLMVFALQRVWAARDHLIRLGVLPSLVMLIVTLPEMGKLMAMLRGVAEATDAADTTRFFPFGICYVLVISVFTVNWIRQLTLGPSAVPGLGLNIGLRHLKFLFFQLAIIFATVLGTTFLSLALHPIGISGLLTAMMLGMLAWFSLLARLSPSWIGIAIDARMPLPIAWKRTAGQGFKLVLAMLAVQVSTVIVAQVVGIVFEVTGLVAAAPLTFLGVAWVLDMIRVAIQVALMVTAYPLFMRETA